MNWTIAILAAGIVVNLINDGGVVLEPSVMNEVEHALARAKPPAEVRQIEGDVFATNGLSATAIAIKLVSMQVLTGRGRCAAPMSPRRRWRYFRKCRVLQFPGKIV